MSATAERTLLGIVLMIGSVLTLSLMDAMIKHVVQSLPAFEAAALRAFMIVLLVIPMVMAQGGVRVLRTRRPWLHFARAGTAFIAIATFFESLRIMPLATVIAIGLASPLIMTALSVPLFKERVGPHRWGAIIVGFCGVMVITQPGTAGITAWGAALVLVSTGFFALTQLCVRGLARGDTDLSILFYTNLGIGLLNLPLLPLVWVPVPLATLGWIAAMGALLLLGQFLAIRAYRHASVGATAPYQYLELGFAAYFGWAIWGESVAPNVWAGAAIIVASGLYVLYRETRNARRAPGEEATP